MLIYLLLFSLNFFVLYNSTFLRNKINLSNNHYIQLITKINSIIHANIIVILSILFSFNIISVDTWAYWLNITRAYCLYDSLLILYYNPNKLMILHHFLLFYGTYSSFILKFPFQVAQGLLCESSNQHLHFGWFLIKKGKEKTLGFKINALILLVEFFLFRFLNFIYLTLFSLFYCDKIEFFILSLVTIMNIYWFSLLIKKAFKIDL
jgi:hypothetical protein